MRGKLRFVCCALALLLAAPPAQAGYFIGNWSWCWHPAKDCPRGDYSWLHYWAPELFRQGTVGDSAGPPTVAHTSEFAVPVP